MIHEDGAEVLLRELQEQTKIAKEELRAAERLVSARRERLVDLACALRHAAIRTERATRACRYEMPLDYGQEQEAAGSEGEGASEQPTESKRAELREAKKAFTLVWPPVDGVRVRIKATMAELDSKQSED